MKIIVINPKAGNATNPATKGKIVPLKRLPTKTASGIDIRLDVAEVMAAPIPAICPKGSMQRAMRFPNKRPVQKNMAAKIVTKTTKGGVPS